MKEYIERELLLIGVDGCISVLHAQAKGDPIQEGAIKLLGATRDYIASLPAADVAPVRHGKWLIGEGVTEGGETVPLFICSECRNYSRSKFASVWSYCPNCGALMGGKEAAHD